MTAQHGTIASGLAVALAAAAVPAVPAEAAWTAGAGVLIALIGLVSQVVRTVDRRLDQSHSIESKRRENADLRAALSSEAKILLQVYTEAVDSDLPHRDPSRRLVEIHRALNDTEVSDGHR